MSAVAFFFLLTICGSATFWLGGLQRVSFTLSSFAASKVNTLAK